MARKRTKSDSSAERARMLVPLDELKRRLQLVDRVLRLRDKAQEAADEARRKKRRVKPDSEAKISIKAVRSAYLLDADLKAIPFRSLYTLALAHERVGGRLEALVRRLGQGKALEIALITDDDEELREKLLKKGRYLKLQSGRRKVIEQVTIAELRTYIADHRAQPGSETAKKRQALLGGKRGPRVRWPEHLQRVLAQLMDETMWTRLQQAFKLFESGGDVPEVMEGGVNPGSRKLPPLGRPELKRIHVRVDKLASMLDATIKRGRRMMP